MYEVTVRDNLFIAHSLQDDFFGPAKNLHGATYVIDLILSSREMTDKNVVIDIGLASNLLHKCIEVYNYKNLDDIDSLSGVITTTEFMAKKLTTDFISLLEKEQFDISRLYSIKMILNESHIASASYEQIINE
ncbi:MAG: 6-carboxytetrahydropterin synthase [Gammaproteobacteria bacterium]|jgi:6-pyruvoyltetrahydropterin/6-carboxytetrahydropterin synthase|nr:6-carboxytetrahydropterin synthase [Gammaproteobacteria bacterium]MBT4462624.1 6-carboxytetrahydropterin synthase [Gammaproteobacteria bacterium]MBT4654871.1 6-carboxytetrahydropterin synthase [Gammaproteobacteria bacterium]MBT5116629.1 6-carboxytetrahydropterin synthase [Gammaproteobacteria bacterium]MBT5761744.1 6-carboxytetrahydropterin synthase [Gammaproteobacteria bacterium]